MYGWMYSFFLATYRESVLLQFSQFSEEEKFGIVSWVSVDREEIKKHTKGYVKGELFGGYIIRYIGIPPILPSIQIDLFICPSEQ